ncbi:uncharacterized protein LOC128722634 [Anopheles nili]|uniref:uncharacterized protein LOC128722634 n=1 Tax=Anopheles nili TaxID=185578 RepID=UPI00237BC49E|nr:uncharacterized protein LOC128722634 [Anopheles nili]
MLRSDNGPTGGRGSKVLLRSTSFQKLCSIPYSFKIEAIRSYKEYFKTIIRLLKAATRACVISIYFKLTTIVYLNATFYKHDGWLKICQYSKSNILRFFNIQAQPNGHLNKNTKQHKRHNIASMYSNITDTSVWLIILKPIVQTLLTYVCVGYIGLQIWWILCALSYTSTPFPFGLVFLMMDLSYMGFIISKIALKGN